MQLWAGVPPQASGRHPPLEEAPGAVQPRLAANSGNSHYYTVVPDESSFDDSFEDAKDEVIN